MSEDSKAKVCVLSSSRVIAKAIANFSDNEAYILSFESTPKLSALAQNIDIFVVDAQLLAERNYRLKDVLLSSSPMALILGLIDSGETVTSLGDSIDWAISYEDLRSGINEAVQVLKVIRRKANRGVLFDEMLTVSRSVKHDACNALAIACGAAGRLAKMPGVAENPFYLQMTDAVYYTQI